MKLQVLGRKVHYWISILLAIPLLIVIGSGLLLQLKKQIPWVQPPEHRGVAKEPSISFTRILEICQTVPEAAIARWSDVNRIDVRPGRGMMKVRAANNWEIQIDSRTGSILHVAYRRSDIIEAFHDGSWFHEWVKLGVFLPAGLVLLVAWLTGLYLFWLPFDARLRRRRAIGERETASA